MLLQSAGRSGGFQEEEEEEEEEEEPEPEPAHALQPGARHALIAPGREAEGGAEGEAGVLRFRVRLHGDSG